MAQPVGSLLSSAAALGDQRSKTEAYRAALQQILESQSVEACLDFVAHMLSDDVQLVISRQLLLLFAQGASKLPQEAHIQVATQSLERLQPRVVSFEDSVVLLREELSGALEAREQWSRAAGVLAGIDLESGSRQVDPAYKLSKCIKIAMLYLEDEDSVNAETFIKKAAALITAAKDEALELQYKTCYARILDAKRRFLDAAMRYYELSQLRGTAGVSDEDLETALRAAITCAILAPAGPQRSRMLAALYKDERSSRTGDLWPLLEKVYLERILDRREIDAFAQTLRPHQLATLPDGTTVLDRAMVQHNLLSASRLYTSITTQQLGGLLGVAPERAEAIAADMVSEGRMPGSIDQVDQLIHFGGKVEALLQWDSHIQGLCSKVGDVLECVQRLGLHQPAV